jgi:hypothetical protein
MNTCEKTPWGGGVGKEWKKQIPRCAGRPFTGANGKRKSACSARNDNGGVLPPFVPQGKQGKGRAKGRPYTPGTGEAVPRSTLELFHSGDGVNG